LKTITFTRRALADLTTHRSDAARIRAKIERYALTGAGDVANLVGSDLRRMRVGQYRVILAETAEMLEVLRIKPRGSAYE
jgi:mRNA interferase RelE/StbE